MSVNRIWIQFYKESYICGEPVQGTINVNCVQPVSGSELKFKLKAYEEAKWVDLSQIHVTPEQPLNIPENQISRVNDVDVSDDSSDSDEEDCPDRNKPEYIRKGNNPAVFRVTRGEGKHRILGQTHELGNLTVGQHSFPFQFNSLQEWPGSFLQEENKAKGKIKYNVIAWYGKFRTKSEIFFQEYKRSESDRLSSNASITSCCCLSKGNLKLDVSFSKDALYVGEEQEVNIDLDCTQLSCNVNSVNVALVNTVTFISDQGGQRSFSNNVFNKAATGCQAGQTSKQNQRFTVQVNQGKHNNRPTCNGRIVRSKYNMNVYTSNDASCTCCSSDAAVGNETHIYCRPTTSNAVYQEANWNPSVRQVLNLPLLPPVIKPKKYKVVIGPVTVNLGALGFNQGNQNNGGQQNNGFNQPQMNGVSGGPQQNNNNQPPGQFNYNNQNNQGVSGGPKPNNNNAPPGQYNYNNQGGVTGGPQANNNNAPPGQYNYNNNNQGGVTGGPQANNNNAPPGQFNYNNNQGGVSGGPQANNNNAPPGQYNYNNNQGGVSGGPQANNNNAPPGQYNYNNNQGGVGGGPQANNNNAPPGQYNYNNQGGVGGGPHANNNNAPPGQYNYNNQGGVGGGPQANNNNAPPGQYNYNNQGGVGGGPQANNNNAPPGQYNYNGASGVPPQQGQGNNMHAAQQHQGGPQQNQGFVNNNQNHF